MENGFKTAIIGLGIIGGSMAYALRGFKNTEITGCDRDASVMEQALKSGAADKICKDSGDAVEGADLVIIATYPDSIVNIVRDNRNRFKKGAVITDICGVKTRIAREIAQVLPEGVRYVGSHPMAGKEVEGFENAEADLFKGCGYIITPTENSDRESTELVYSMAKYMGAEKIAVNTPEEHDEIIAYTSDLMHIASCALCLDFNPKMNLAYTAGAFRDCTRVALINPELWTELFTENAEHTIKEIDKLTESLELFRQAVKNRDEEELYRLLARVRENKIDILTRTPKSIEEIYNENNRG